MHGISWPLLPGLNEEQVVSLGRCGSPEQFYHMMEAYRRRECPFCHRKHLDGEIVYEGKYWFAFTPPGTFNSKEGRLTYKLVIPYYGHVSQLERISGEQMAEFWKVLMLARASIGVHDPNGGVLYLRHGNALWNGATVCGHLHWNDDGPNGRGEVRPAVFKDEAGWKKDYYRLMRYWPIYRKGMTKVEYLRAYEAAYAGD